MKIKTEEAKEAVRTLDEAEEALRLSVLNKAAGKLVDLYNNHHQSIEIIARNILRIFMQAGVMFIDPLELANLQTFLKLSKVNQNFISTVTNYIKKKFSDSEASEKLASLEKDLKHILKQSNNSEDISEQTYKEIDKAFKKSEVTLITSREILKIYFAINDTLYLDMIIPESISDYIYNNYIGVLELSPIGETNTPME